MVEFQTKLKMQIACPTDETKLWLQSPSVNSIKILVLDPQLCTRMYVGMHNDWPD